jgi:hypothetical protein
MAVHVGFMVDKVAMWQYSICFQYFDFPLSLIIPPVTLFTSIHMTQTLYNPRTDSFAK